MMSAPYQSNHATFRIAPATWLFLAGAGVVLAMPFRDALAVMFDTWFTQEEYSHGVLIPVVTLFLVWQRKDELERMPFRGSWWGLALIGLGGALYLLGELSAIYALSQYAFLIVFYGVVLSFTGPAVFRRLWMPLLILVFMIPLPAFLLSNFSAALQLISSRIGVAFIRLFGISVYLEGNVIDLGSYQLQVAEACDGLRYLFPLMTLGFIMAYFFRAAMWKRIVLFASSIPITILMNSFRIGTIGVMVEHWGTSMAEGFLHDFQGWAVFMASAAVMLLEIVVLAPIGPNRRPWRESFGFELPARSSTGTAVVNRYPGAPFVGALVLLAALAMAGLFLPSRAEVVPARELFASFPLRIGAWDGRSVPIDQIFLDALRLDDYLNADFRAAGSPPLNFYVAYYASQRSGQSAHSPRACIPGGGWQITSLGEVPIPVAEGRVIQANRVVIQLGTQRQIVYYWFQQRGRAITSEYLVKWYIFWDALTRSRTDGALVRVSAPLPTSAGESKLDDELRNFVRIAAPALAAHVPD